MICSGLLILMVFAAGARLKHLVTAGIAGLGALSVLVIMEPYRIRRLFSFLDPDADPLGDSYQIRQALISFGSGDWTGLGWEVDKTRLFTRGPYRLCFQFLVKNWADGCEYCCHFVCALRVARLQSRSSGTFIIWRSTRIWHHGLNRF